jgi:hypothetical protein
LSNSSSNNVATICKKEPPKRLFQSLGQISQFWRIYIEKEWSCYIIKIIHIHRLTFLFGLKHNILFFFSLSLALTHFFEWKFCNQLVKWVIQPVEQRLLNTTHKKNYYNLNEKPTCAYCVTWAREQFWEKKTATIFLHIIQKKNCCLVCNFFVF